MPPNTIWLPVALKPYSTDQVVLHCLVGDTNSSSRYDRHHLSRVKISSLIRTQEETYHSQQQHDKSVTKWALPGYANRSVTRCWDLR